MKKERDGVLSKVWWRRRAAVNSVINHANPEALTAFIREYPHQDQQIAQFAIRCCDNFATWESLLLGLGLVIADSSSAVEVLKKLIDHHKNPALAREYPVRWERLEADQLKAVFKYLQKHGEQTVADELMMQLPIEQCLQVMPDIGDAAFPKTLAVYLKSNKPIDRMTDYLTSYLEELALSGTGESGPASVALLNCVLAVDHIWNAGKIDDALDVLTALSAVKPETFTSFSPGLIREDFLRRIAQELQRLVDVLVSDYVDRDKGLSVVRAANLLRRLPSPFWAPSLKEAWVEVAESARLRREEGTNEAYGSDKIPPVVAAAANSLAIALGVCAAIDENYTSLELSTPTPRELEERIRARNALVEEHNRLVRDFHQTQGRSLDIPERIIELKDRIHETEDRIEELKSDQMRQLSPGYLLLLALQDEQAYTADIRQGAAWGLWKLCEVGHLGEASRQKINEAIRRAVSGGDDAELRDRLSQVIPNDEMLRQTVLDASRDYFYTRNLQRFLNVLSHLPLSDDVRKRIVAVVRSFTLHELSHHFRERHIQFLPGQRLLELEQTLLDGLVWMADLVEVPEADERSDEETGDYQNVREIIKLLRELMPKALEFLSRYPLRLMTLEQHKRMLGQYSRTKSDITLWTRYSPPLWRRGAKPEEVGVVHARYLDLDDRSTPNAMGIYYRLFRHPILALPVMYHEYLHYGGPAGAPAEGIENETEVLLREILFARGLMAQLAPEGDERIPEFERELIHEIQTAGMEGLGLQLGYNLRDDAALEAICEQIERTYGRQLSQEEAEQQILGLIDFRNRSIQLENLTHEMKRKWYPEIEWPYLSTEKTKYLTKEYRRILLHSLTSDHRIDSDRRDQILEDAVCRESLEAWEAYKRRKHALVELEKAWSAESTRIREVLAYIVNRIGPLTTLDADGHEDTSELARIFAYWLR